MEMRMIALTGLASLVIAGCASTNQTPVQEKSTYILKLRTPIADTVREISRMPVLNPYKYDGNMPTVKPDSSEYNMPTLRPND